MLEGEMIGHNLLTSKEIYLEHELVDLWNRNGKTQKIKIVSTKFQVYILQPFTKIYIVIQGDKG